MIAIYDEVTSDNWSAQTGRRCTAETSTTNEAAGENHEYGKKHQRLTSMVSWVWLGWQREEIYQSKASRTDRKHRTNHEADGVAK